MLPADHPERYGLSEEVHARPPEPLETPVRASFTAVLIEPEARREEIQHLGALCRRFGLAAPAEDATHLSTRLGSLRLKWERHSEFSGYMFMLPGPDPGSFDESAASLLPPRWLADLPGLTIMASHARLITGDSAWDHPDLTALSAQFDGNGLIGAAIAQGAGLAFTDFKIHRDGFSRFLLVDRGLTPRQAGRLLQRLFEIEAYRMLALLALPIARRQSPRLTAIEQALAGLTDDIARNSEEDDERLLQQLTRLAAEVESGLSASQFRFSACKAYHELVERRILELGERPLAGLQTIDEFMTRRLSPAVATCASVSQRLHDLSERVAQASALLSTRVDIARERQNQALLGSMERRARQQLQLQLTVEGLSLAAIVYYLTGLIGDLFHALRAGGVPVDPEVAVGIAIPVVALIIALALRRVHHGLARNAAESV